jgi:hypothetical protein
MAQPSFDPCRQWLGIDAVDLGDPRRVLGLTAAETDPMVVLRAADARISRLKGLAPGPFAMARDALVRRVEESRETVLGEIARRQPAAAIGSRGFAMPPPPGGLPQPPSPAVLHSAETAEECISIRPVTNYRKSSSGANAVLGLLLVGLATTAGGLFWYQANGRLAGGPKPAQTARPEPTVAMPPAPEAVVDPAPPVPEPEPEQRAKPVLTKKTEATLEPVSVPAPVPAPVPEPSPEPVPQPTPAPDPRPAIPVDPLLRDAFAALQRQRFDAADEAIAAAAATAAADAPLLGRVAQWKLLATYARGFAGFREEALKTLASGQEFDVNGKKIGIVEIDAEKIVYRSAGRNRTVPRDRIPAGILLSIVTTWFDGRPANDLYLGAFHSTKAEPDLAKARAAWERAAAGGAAAAELMPLLEDPLILQAAEGSDQ